LVGLIERNTSQKTFHPAEFKSIDRFWLRLNRLQTVA